MDFKNRDILSAKDFSREEFLYIAEVADRFRTSKGFVGSGVHRRNLLDNKSVALLFLEPSTRTQFGFASAAEMMGGRYASYTRQEFMESGESLEDIASIFFAYQYDALVVRHSENNAAHVASNSIKWLASHLKMPTIPVINAGDGSNEHPTQSMVDLYTIIQRHGTVDGLKIGIFGDLKYGRAAHSLVYALSKFDVEVYFVSDRALSLPAEMRAELDQMGLRYTEEDISALPRVISHLDVGYAPRIQKERFDEGEDYERFKRQFVINNRILERTKSNFILMTPGPKTDEIPAEVEGNPKLAYFEAVKYRLDVDQALLALTLGALK